MFESAVDRAGLASSSTARRCPSRSYVDREMWAKIVLNLLSNALKFTFDGGDHGAAARPSTARRRAERDRHRHRHRRRRSRRACSSGSTASAAPARAPTRAPGIGLALVAELAALHGGDGRVEQRAGRGQHVHGPACRSAPRTCPRTQVAAAPTGRRGRRPRQAEGFLPRRCAGSAPGRARRRRPSASAPATAPRVLVVDDNADMRDYIAALLDGRLRGRDGRRTARPRWRWPGASRPTSCSPT